MSSCRQRLNAVGAFPEVLSFPLLGFPFGFIPQAHSFPSCSSNCWLPGQVYDKIRPEAGIVDLAAEEAAERRKDGVSKKND